MAYYHTAICLLITSGICLNSATILRQSAADDPLVELKKISNDQITVGLKPDSGGAIAWVSAGPAAKNLVNAHDRGRLIQQSYYGKADGSKWAKQDWRWNPVQGGDWRGTSSKLLELKVEDTKAYAKTLPKHWASGRDIATATMEQWIELTGPVAHIKYRFEQHGGQDHPAVHQELPAVFIRADRKHLVLYDGAKPWSDEPLSRKVPGWPNEYGKMTEHWAAYVDEQDNGLGVYVPVASELTCYRFGNDDPANESGLFILCTDKYLCDYRRFCLAVRCLSYGGFSHRDTRAL